MTTAKRGVFIVLEGIDRTGKTTQAHLLYNYLIQEGVQCVVMRFPDRSTPIGRVLNRHLVQGTKIEDHATHLLFSANRWEAKETILSHLAAGTTVICDRYAYSGVAFSVSKGLDLEWCKTSDRGLPRPDVVLYFDLSINDAMKRGGFGKEVYEKEETQRKVKQIYEGSLLEDYWIHIPADRSVETISAELQNVALATIAAYETTSEPALLWIHQNVQSGRCCFGDGFEIRTEHAITPNVKSHKVLYECPEHQVKGVAWVPVCDFTRLPVESDSTDSDNETKVDYKETMNRLSSLSVAEAGVSFLKEP